MKPGLGDPKSLSQYGLIDEESGTRRNGQAPAPMEVRIGGLEDPAVKAFLEEHLEDMRSVSPPQSKHALAIEALSQPDIAFWSVWRGRELIACAALKELTEAHGEIKSMRVSRSCRGTGVGAALLDYVLNQARERQYQRVSLETGSMPFFAPARALYERYEFKRCEPFADYRPDPNSVFMTLELV